MLFAEIVRRWHSRNKSPMRKIATVARLRIVAVADVCPAANRACVKFHHVPLVAAAPVPDLFDRAKHLLDSANVGWPQGNSPPRAADRAIRGSPACAPR